jgi:hypothetical protein
MKYLLTFFGLLLTTHLSVAFAGCCPTATGNCCSSSCQRSCAKVIDTEVDDKTLLFKKVIKENKTIKLSSFSVEVVEKCSNIEII